MVKMYFFSPFFEEAGTMLLGASRLWHPWSVRRREELFQISFGLKNEDAKTYRRRGLAWASNVTKFGEDPAGVLSSRVFYRYHQKKELPPCPEAAQYMAAIAFNLLIILLHSFEKIKESSFSGYQEKENLIKHISEIIETIAEAPYYDPALKIPDNMMRIVGIHGILNECEGLAYMQARIEDNFSSKNPGMKKKKKSKLSDDELRELSIEIGMPFETVKDVFETEYSSWWEESRVYKKLAQTQREIFLSSLHPEKDIRESIGSAWDPGSATNEEGFECWNEKSLLKSENIIKTFISALFSIVENDIDPDNPGEKRKMLIPPCQNLPPLQC